MMNTLDYSLVRLFPADDGKIINHINFLSDQDRYLRFGYNISPYQLETYVTKSLSTNNTKEKSDFWFGVLNNDSQLVATLHVSIFDDVAEFGFTTATNHRGKKLGQLLFARAYQLITEHSVTKIYLIFLSENKPMRHIAKKFGMSVLTQGSDSEASVNISYPVPLSKVHTVKMSMIDKTLFES